jgi:hypothetical protein
MLEFPLPPPQTAPGEFSNALFGSALAGLTSSGGTFLAVGAPGYNANAGAVFIFQVQRSIAIGPMLIRRLDAPAAGSFGAALAAGDFTGDDQPDLVVGAPGVNNSSGSVYVFPGVLDGGIVDTHPMPFGPTTSFAALGSSVAVFRDGLSGFIVATQPSDSNSELITSDGMMPLQLSGTGPGIGVLDATGDGHPDVVIGTPNSGALLTNDGAMWSTAWMSSEPQTQLGTSVTAVGDLNMNGTQDVLAGAPSSSIGVQFFDGNALKAGMSWGGIGITTPQSNSQFGQTMARAGKFGGPDLKVVVGAPGEGGGTGAIHLYTTQLFPVFVEAWPGGVAGKAGSSRFGSAIAGELDLDGDGNVDFAVGAPGVNANAGEVELFFGTPPQLCVAACAECEACVNGACVPKPDSTKCTPPDFCTSQAACSSSACVPTQATCGMGACDANRQRCVMGTIWLFDDGARHAVAGQPYDYNPPSNTLRVQGGAPSPRYYTCDAGPPGFDIDQDGGIVKWTPQAAGDVSVCIGVIDSSMYSDQFTYTVTVAPPLEADFGVAPAEGPAPLQVNVAPVTPNTTAQRWTWDFGDMTPLVDGAQQTHKYAMPGTYPIDVRVWVAGLTQASTARRFVTVLDGISNRPPQAEIFYDGGTFSCACAAGSAGIDTIQWDFEDGGTTGSTASRTFGPGAHRVRLTVTDQNGLSGFDAMMVSVPANGVSPPECRLSAQPPAGPAPLLVQWSALAPLFAQLDAPLSPQTYLDEGPHRANLVVTADGGLSCNEFAFATVLAPAAARIAFTNEPSLGGQCGEAFTYTPTVTGPGPIMLSLSGPPGAVLQGGTVSWTPASAGIYPFDITAANAMGQHTTKSFVVEVSCGGLLPDGGMAPPLDFHARACGCGAAGGAPVLLLALVRLLRRRR